MKALPVIAVLVAASLAAIAAFALPAGAAEPDEARGLTVVGTASVEANPDLAEWSFGVQSGGAEARAALRSTAAAMHRVLAALRAAGIAEQDLRTESVSLHPTWSDDGRPDGRYTASSTVHATVRDIARAGAAVDAAVAAGANEVFGPNLLVEQREELYRDALARAYRSAERKAQALVSRNGFSLGRPLEVVEGDGMQPLPAMERANADVSASDVPIEPGRTETQATVTVTFAIL